MDTHAYPRGLEPDTTPGRGARASEWAQQERALRESEERIAYLALHDHLTGLPNRGWLESHLTRTLTRVPSNHQAVAILIFNIDDFWLVNDSLGHFAGDQLLRQIGARLQHRKRPSDFLARQGGDEFMVLLEDLGADARKVAEGVAERLLGALREAFSVADASFSVTASAGISIYPHDAGSAEGLLKNADVAMHQAKRAGGDGWAPYSPEADDPRAQLPMTMRLPKALSEGELLLHYQPIFTLPEAEPTHLEALLRWQDPDRGMISPAQFIPLAEKTGLIEPIGEWVIESICQQTCRWRKLGLRPQISFNVSPRQLHAPTLVPSLRRILDAYGVDPSQLTVEITESAAAGDPQRTQRVLEDLHDLGLGLAIDDFGSGYSSLSRLREMPFQWLKIDGALLVGLPGDQSAASVVRSILQLAEALGLQTVAEGVETDTQLRFMVEAGCALAQGFHLSRPLPADEVTGLLLRASPTTVA